MLVLRYIGIDAVLAVFVLATLFCQNVKGNAEYRAHAKLLDKLFLSYDKISHPTPNIKTPVNATLGIAVAQLVRVDERMEGMNLNVWYRMAWKDYRLTWNPREYGNITEFKIDSDYLWIPDIMIYKPLTSDAGQVLGSKSDDDDLAWKIGISSDGTASFNFPGSIYGQCSLTIADYPYDEHKCSFKFSSWVHDGSELVLKLRRDNALDFGSYVHNNEWHIVGSEAQALEEKFDCCPYPFYTTSFNIHVRRGASSYVSNYIIPSILIAILSIMMFTLPPEVGKRMEIGINLLLCLSVYLTILNTKMPSRSDVFPLLSKFYGCCIFILTCALLCTCWVVAYYFHDMSGWKLYPMSKFVDIGILHYLRRALRFPNATKVYPSDILESVNTQQTIEVKPMMNERTNFARVSPINNPDIETKPVDKDTKVAKKEKEDTKSVEKVTNNMKKIPTERKESRKQSDNSLHENRPRQKAITEKKDAVVSNEKQNNRDLEKADDKKMRKPKDGNLEKANDKEKEKLTDGDQGKLENKKKKKPKDGNLEKTNNKEEEKLTDGNQGKVQNKEKKKPKDGDPGRSDDKEKRKQRKKLKELENLDKVKEDAAAEREPMDSKKDKKDENKEKPRKREESEEPVEKKRKPSVETKPDETRRVSNPSENTRNARSASRESNSSETSKKSNNIFANTVAPGLIEKPKRDRRRKKPKKEDLGVVNLGVENEEEGNKETGNKKENVSTEEAKKMTDVREAPSLKDKTEVTVGETKPSENVSSLAKGQIFDKKITSDEDFDTKQESKKKHDSIKLLKELATYFSDHLERKKNRYQWRQAAVVLNRLFLIILCISIGMSIVLVFLAR